MVMILELCHERTLQHEGTFWFYFSCRHAAESPLKAQVHIHVLQIDIVASNRRLEFHIELMFSRRIFYRVAVTFAIYNLLLVILCYFIVTLT